MYGYRRTTTDIEPELCGSWVVVADVLSRTQRCVWTLLIGRTPLQAFYMVESL